jgi:hypothetical protein
MAFQGSLKTVPRGGILGCRNATVANWTFSRIAPFGAIVGDRMVSELQAVIEELGGEPVLGRPLRSGADLQSAIREGFPQPAVQEVMQGAGITLKELASSLDLSARSLQRRRAGRLAGYESDRLYRLARIVALAKHLSARRIWLPDG